MFAAGETDQDWRQTIDLVQKYRFPHCHISQARLTCHVCHAMAIALCHSGVSVLQTFRIHHPDDIPFCCADVSAAWHPGSPHEEGARRAMKAHCKCPRDSRRAPISLTEKAAVHQKQPETAPDASFWLRPALQIAQA